MPLKRQFLPRSIQEEGQHSTYRVSTRKDQAGSGGRGNEAEAWIRTFITVWCGRNRFCRMSRLSTAGLASLNTFSGLRGTGAGPRCLVPDPGVIRVGDSGLMPESLNKEVIGGWAVDGVVGM